LRAFVKGAPVAGVIFPDIGRTLMPLIQMDRQAEREERQNALHQQERRENMAIRKEESDYRRANLEEQKALRLQSHIASLDEKTRAKVKDFSEFRARGGMAVLSAPPEQRAQAYAMYIQEAKARNYDMSLFPQQWDPSTERRLQFDVDQSKPFADFFSQPQAMPPVGGGAPAPGGPMPGGGGGYTPTAFMQGRVKRGDDPVTAAAWAANVEHESSFNPTAFNPKDPNGGSHGLIQWNGPRAQALRQFAAARGGNPADPELQQDFLQSEIDADPQFKAQLAAAPTVQEKAALISMRFIRPAGGQPEAMSRGQTATKYAMGTPPASLVAQGANAAPMPGPPAGMVPPGPPPAQMPNGPQFAQAGGIIPQGDAVAGQGDVMTPPRAAPADDIMVHVDNVRKDARSKGGDVYLDPKTKQPEVQDGRLVIRSTSNPRQVLGYAPLPAKKEQGGAYAGTGMDAQTNNALVRGANDPVFVGTPEYLTAWMHLSQPKQFYDEQQGRMVTVPPNMEMLSRFPKPTFGQQPQGAPGAPAPAQAGAPAPAPQTNASGIKVDQVGDPKKSEAFKKLEIDVRAVGSAMDRFQTIVDETKGGDRWRAVINDPTSAEAQKLLGAFNALKTALRSEAFVNTGVLQPAEMTMLDNMLLAPTTLRGLFATPDAYAAMLDQIKQFVSGKMEAARGAYGVQEKPGAAPSGDLKKKYGLE
jgi:hypothetical protein